MTTMEETHEQLRARMSKGIAPKPIDSFTPARQRFPNMAQTQQDDMQPIKELGLTRGPAITIGIIGLLFAPFLIGLPLAIWGFAADHMIVKEQKRRKQG